MSGGPAWETLQAGAMGFVGALPMLGLAAIVLVAAWVLGQLAGNVVSRLVVRAVREADLGRAIGNLTRFGVVLLGVLIAAVVVFPSVKPADVLAFLGLGSVAVGFAFKDIFQNFMAGLLILFRRPFRLGDQIRSGELEGTVEDINLRATIIKTYDGDRVIIPNSDVYSRPVLVRTAYGIRRSRFVVGIGYGDDIAEAKQVILEGLEALPGVLDEPAPWLRTVELAPSSVNMEVFYWTQAQQHEVLKVGDAVATTIKYALDAAGIDRPFPVRRVLVEEQAPRPAPGSSPSTSQP
ncbi:MAG: mechanosensitive ion channel family protein [Candidatus Sericytochromatia bacterium]